MNISQNPAPTATNPVGVRRVQLGGPLPSEVQRGGEHTLEILNDAHQAMLRLGGFQDEAALMRAHIRASNVLLDACIDAGMSHDEPDHEAWAAERVTRWLVAA